MISVLPLNLFTHIDDVKQMSNKHYERSNDTNVYNVYVHALNVTKLTSSSRNGVMNNEGVLEVCGGLTL